MARGTIRAGEPVRGERHPQWRKFTNNPLAEVQYDWYELLRGEALARGRTADVTAAEKVWDANYKALPSEDMRLFLRQWAIAMRDNAGWRPVWPPNPEHVDGQPVLIVAAAEPAPKAKKEPKPASDRPAPAGQKADCPVCHKPQWKMHLRLHAAKCKG